MPTAEATSRPTPSRILPKAVLSTIFTALAANCFLKYLWWTACYSAWRSVPKLAGRASAAATRASLNGWGVLLLDAATVTILFSAIRFPSSKLPPPVRIILRLAASLALTIAATAVFALALSWFRQGLP